MIDNESTEAPRLIEMYLILSLHLMAIFKLDVQELEKYESSTADVFVILTNLRNRLKSRCNEEFFVYDVHQLLANVCAAETQEATIDFKLFLNSAITYLKIFDFDENSIFGKLLKLTLLDHLFPKYQTLVKIVEHLKLKDKLNLNMDDLFDEVPLIQKNFGTIQSTKLFTESKTTSCKWHFLLKSFNLKCGNVFEIVLFVLSIPGISAYCERIFNVMSSKWCSERNRCSIQLMKSKLLIYFNLKDTRREFSEKIKRDLQLLKSAKSHKKYYFKNYKLMQLQN